MKMNLKQAIEYLNGQVNTLTDICDTLAEASKAQSERIAKLEGKIEVLEKHMPPRRVSAQEFLAYDEC